MIPRHLPMDDLGTYNQLWAVVMQVFESAGPLMRESGMMFLAAFVVAVMSARFAWRWIRQLWG